MSLAFAHRNSRKSALQPQPLRVAGKLAVALRSMIHDATEFQQACEQAGTTTRAVREALDKPHVRAFIKRERQMRLERALLGNITELERIRTGDGAAAVSAIKLLEEMAGDKAQAASTVAATTPGVTINIVNGLASVPGQVIEGQSVHIEAQPLEAGDSATIPPRSDDPV